MMEYREYPHSEIENHWVFEWDSSIALVERTKANGLSRIGSPRLLMERGMAVLVERGGRHLFVAKEVEVEASADQVVALRAFARDLEGALR